MLMVLVIFDIDAAAAVAFMNKNSILDNQQQHTHAQTVLM